MRCIPCISLVIGLGIDFFSWYKSCFPPKNCHGGRDIWYARSRTKATENIRATLTSAFAMGCSHLAALSAKKKKRFAEACSTRASRAHLSMIDTAEVIPAPVQTRTTVATEQVREAFGGSELGRRCVCVCSLFHIWEPLEVCVGYQIV